MLGDGLRHFMEILKGNLLATINIVWFLVVGVFRTSLATN